MFDIFADEELKHKKTFEDFLSNIEDYKPPESYSDEYFAYLRAYVDNLIFIEEKLKKEILDLITLIYK